MGTVDAGHDRGRRARRVPHDRPRPGDRLREGRRQHASRSRASARATASDILWQLPFRDLTIEQGRLGHESFFKAVAHVAVHVQRRLRGRQRHRDVLGRQAAAARPARRPAPAHARARASTSGRASCRRRSTRSRPTRRRACSSTGTTSPAPGWGAADDNWSYGSIHRVRLLTRRPRASTPKHDLASVTSAMNAAATQDLRSVAARRRRCTDAARTARRRRARARSAMLDAARGLAGDRLEPARPRPRRQDGRRPRPGDLGRALPEARRRGAARRRSARSSPRSTASRARQRPRARASPAAASGTSTRTCARCSATKFRDAVHARSFCGGGDRASVRGGAVGGVRGGRRRARGAQGTATRTPGARTPTRSGSRSRPACCRPRSATRTARAASSRSSRSRAPEALRGERAGMGGRASAARPEVRNGGGVGRVTGRQRRVPAGPGVQ